MVSCSFEYVMIVCAFWAMRRRIIGMRIVSIETRIGREQRGDDFLVTRVFIQVFFLRREVSAQTGRAEEYAVTSPGMKRH